MESVMVVERAETEQDNAEGQARTTDQQALRALVTQNQKRLLRYRKGLQDLSLHYHSESSNGMLSDDGEDNSYVEKGTDPALSASKLLIDICAESQPLTGDWALKKLRKLAGLLDEMDQSKHAITVLHIVAALYRSRNTEADRNQLCRALLYLSSLLLSLARREEALTASEEAVTIVETMAELESERYKAHLAAALKMKSICKSDIGDADSAIKAAERAVSIYRYLHTNRPADFETALAGMLMEYSIILSKDRQKEGALQANEECLRMYRSMHTKRSTELEAELAEALCSYSIRLSEFGRIIEALQAIEESIAMQQVLDEMQPGHFTVHLAWGFTHYSTQLFKANRYEDGMEALEESLSMRRFLSQERPSRFLADLAWTLASYSMRLDKLGRRKDALEAIEESLKIRRTLLAARPEISCADLAWTLGMYSTILSKVRRHGEALAAIAECLRIRRSLHLRQPAAFEANLASTTFSYSSHLARAGRVEEAMRACEESLMLYETLYEARPQVHELDLANTRSHHATLLKRLRGNGGPYWRREEPSSTITSLRDINTSARITGHPQLPTYHVTAPLFQHFFVAVMADAIPANTPTGEPHIIVKHLRFVKLAVRRCRGDLIFLDDCAHAGVNPSAVKSLLSPRALDLELGERDLDCLESDLCDVIEEVEMYKRVLSAHRQERMSKATKSDIGPDTDSPVLGESEDARSSSTLKEEKLQHSADDTPLTDRKDEPIRGSDNASTIGYNVESASVCTETSTDGSASEVRAIAKAISDQTAAFETQQNKVVQSIADLSQVIKTELNGPKGINDGVSDVRDIIKATQKPGRILPLAGLGNIHVLSRLNDVTEFKNWTFTLFACLRFHPGAIAHLRMEEYGVGTNPLDPCRASANYNRGLDEELADIIALTFGGDFVISFTDGIDHSDLWRGSLFMQEILRVARIFDGGASF
ncbi:hypothetical protein CF327_g7103 [Tilletia walkeri]|nr:hypothetical protein CF327_g7103 [Tilletia walkeri]